jgi:glycosyltransferase involved in cell wall biosynthesis
MLVDNDVERDSRVQKQARSMAEAGWNVTLLGKAGPRGARRWKIGEATVRLLPTPATLGRRPGDLRRARLRSPLAYAAGWVADNRRQTVRARKADLRQRIIAGQHPGGANGRRADSLRLLPARAHAAVLGRWVDLRAEKTAKLTRRRQQADAPLDRLTTAFWQKVLGDRSWRRFDPHLWDFELAYGPELDRLRPDIIHANDFRMLGVGARAVVRAREQGREVKLVWDAHEFLPGIKPWEPHPRWHLAQIAHEREYAGAADVVVTVSDELADLLQETHGLAARPTVVLNTPYAAQAHETAHQPSIREAVGVGPDVPIMVYSGLAAYQRGLDVMVDALPQLPGVVCAFVVAKPESDYVRSLVARARELGVEDRVRLLPYVPFDQVVPFLSSADVGVIPIHHWPNHEIALITKFFEYAHARLPIVVSDVKAMAHATRETGQGEVFEAESVDSFVAAARKVLENPAAYRRVYDDPAVLERWTWEAQAAILDRVYSDLLDRRPSGRS